MDTRAREVYPIFCEATGLSFRVGSAGFETKPIFFEIARQNLVLEAVELRLMYFTLSLGQGLREKELICVGL